MKIAVVTPYPPSKGTLNEYAFHLINQFVKKEEITKIHILTDELPDNGTYPKHENHKIDVIPCWSFNSWKSILRINKAIQKVKPDIVLYNIQFLSFGDKKIPSALGLFSPWLTKMRRIKSIVLLHNILEEVDLEKAGITSNAILRWVYNFIGTLLTKILLKADLLGVTITKYVETLENKYKAKNVILLPHGSFETPPEPNFEDEPEDFTLMTFGKFGTYKKVEDLIEATDELKNEIGKKIKLVIAGSNSPNTPNYLEKVQEKYATIADVQFTGYVAEEDIPIIFSNCHAVVFPYTSTTGSSGVLHQAGSYGKAVVLPRIGDLERLIEEEGYQGSYFEANSIASLKEALHKVLTNKSFRMSLAKKNYSAASGLSLEEIADWYLMHFSNLLR